MPTIYERAEAADELPLKKVCAGTYRTKDNKYEINFHPGHLMWFVIKDPDGEAWQDAGEWFDSLSEARTEIFKREYK
jgi:hypothetical protein